MRGDVPGPSAQRSALPRPTLPGTGVRSRARALTERRRRSAAGWGESVDAILLLVPAPIRAVLAAVRCRRR